MRRQELERDRVVDDKGVSNAFPDNGSLILQIRGIFDLDRGLLSRGRYVETIDILPGV